MKKKDQEAIANLYTEGKSFIPPMRYDDGTDGDYSANLESDWEDLQSSEEKTDQESGRLSPNIESSLRNLKQMTDHLNKLYSKFEEDPYWWDDWKQGVENLYTILDELKSSDDESIKKLANTYDWRDNDWKAKQSRY